MPVSLFHRFFTLSLFCATLFACQNATKESTVTAEGNAGFVANPQPVTKREEVPTLKIGSAAPDFKLPGTDGKFYALSDFAAAKVLVVVFTCDHCPTAQAYEDRLIAVANDYKAKGVDVVAISPNSPLGLLYEELGYTDLNDDYTEMKIRAGNKKFPFPYLYDGDNEAVSLQYGPVATPHVFVFDKDRKLQYAGRMDAVEKPGKANAEDLRAALDAMVEGKIPAVQETKTFGCSTKWGWKIEYNEKSEKEWNDKPVTLKELDVNGVKALVANNDSKKLRLINVWASWCGPCMREYPDFIVLQRMYGARDFEFVSVAADDLAKREKVNSFLQEKHSAVPNYLFANEDKYALIEAIDKNWNGALPYTLLVEPGGKVVWSHQGDVDFYALKKVIVENPMIGRYF